MGLLYSFAFIVVCESTITKIICSSQKIDLKVRIKPPFILCNVWFLNICEAGRGHMIAYFFSTDFNVLRQMYNWVRKSYRK